MNEIALWPEGWEPEEKVPGAWYRANGYDFWRTRPRGYWQYGRSRADEPGFLDHGATLEDVIEAARKRDIEGDPVHSDQATTDRKNITWVRFGN